MLACVEVEGGEGDALVFPCTRSLNASTTSSPVEEKDQRVILRTVSTRLRSQFEIIEFLSV